MADFDLAASLESFAGCCPGCGRLLDVNGSSRDPDVMAPQRGRVDAGCPECEREFVYLISAADPEWRIGYEVKDWSDMDIEEMVAGIMAIEPLQLALFPGRT